MRSLVLVALALFFCPAFAMGENTQWEVYFSEAHRAFESKNYWQARRMFNASLEEAQRCHEEDLFARRLDSLAESYAQKRRFKVAEALHKKAVQIFRSRFGADHNSVVDSMRRYVQVVKRASGELKAEAPGSVPLIASASR